MKVAKIVAAHYADADLAAPDDPDAKHVRGQAVAAYRPAPSADAVQKIHERAGHPDDEIHEITVTA